jgi:hypothetical protein
MLNYLEIAYYLCHFTLLESLHVSYLRRDSTFRCRILGQNDAGLKKILLKFRKVSFNFDFAVLKWQTGNSN